MYSEPLNKHELAMQVIKKLSLHPLNVKKRHAIPSIYHKG